MDLALTKSILYRGFNLNSVAHVAATGGATPRLVGCQVSSANMQDITLVQYREKRAQADSADIGPVTGSYWWLNLIGTIYGSSKGDLHDRVQALRAALAPRNAWWESPQTQGFLPLTYTSGEGASMLLQLVRPNGVDILWGKDKHGGPIGDPTAVAWSARLLVNGPMLVSALPQTNFRYLLDRWYTDTLVNYFGVDRFQVEILEAMAPPGQGTVPWGRVVSATVNELLDNRHATKGTFWVSQAIRDFARFTIPTGAKSCSISGVVRPAKGVQLNPTRDIIDVPPLDWEVYAVWVDGQSVSSLSTTFGAIQEDDNIADVTKGISLPTLGRILLASGSYAGGPGFWEGAATFYNDKGVTLPGQSNYRATYTKAWSKTLSETDLAGHTEFALMIKLKAWTEEQAYYPVDGPSPTPDYYNQLGNYAKWPGRQAMPGTDPHGNLSTGALNGTAQGIGVRSTFSVGFWVP